MVAELLAVLAAADAEETKAGGELVVIRPVAVRAVRAELARRRHIPQPDSSSQVATQLRGRDAELTEIVRDGQVVPESGRDLTVRPQGSGKTPAEELVRHHAIVCEP